MERKRALAIAGATTLMVGSAIVAGAAVGGATLLGFGGEGNGPGSFTLAEQPVVATEQATTPTTEHVKVVTKTRDVFDRQVVVDPPAVTPPAPDDGSQDPSGSTGSGTGDVGNPATGGTNSDDGANHDATNHDATNGDGNDDPVTTKTTTPTSVPASHHEDSGGSVTPEIPEDWPADKPIPPMPANCLEPHLEDNGVWNCGSDD